jgi:hypothetical protein
MGCTGLIKVKCVEDAVEPVGGVAKHDPPSVNFRKQILSDITRSPTPLFLSKQPHAVRFAGP